MKTEYRTDPVTGVRYAWGGVMGIRTLDEQHAQALDVEKMLTRRLPEILTPPPRPSVGSRIRDQVRLGWRADPITGQVICPECDKSSRPDVEFCGNCGNPLIPLEEYTGVQDGETVKCAECSRMNSASSNFCTGCGYALPAFTASASSRPRRSVTRLQHPRPTPAPAVYPAPAATAHEGYRSRGFLVARETFDAVDPTTHKVVHVLAGRTNVASGHWLLKVRPDAFQYAA